MVAPASQSPAPPATGSSATGMAAIARLALLSLVLALGNAPALAAGKAAVAAPDEYGARIAMEVMGHGGNAVDAAVATAFVLAVTYPEAGNLGGGGFMMIYRDGKPACLDYRETAPAAATRDMYLDAKGAVIKNASIIGPRAAGVPGTVRRDVGRAPALRQAAVARAAAAGHRAGARRASSLRPRHGEAHPARRAAATPASPTSISTSAPCRRARCSASRSSPRRSSASPPVARTGFYRGKTAQLAGGTDGPRRPDHARRPRRLQGQVARADDRPMARHGNTDGATAELRRLRADRAARDARCARAAVRGPRAQLHAVRAPDRRDGKARIR